MATLRVTLGNKILAEKEFVESSEDLKECPKIYDSVTGNEITKQEFTIEQERLIVGDLSDKINNLIKLINLVINQSNKEQYKEIIQTIINDVNSYLESVGISMRYYIKNDIKFKIGHDKLYD